MNFYSLLLLALTLASSFCVVARSPFLTACRRSCSFPMISTSQNSTSVPQESCSSLTPPYSGATVAWTYPRILFSVVFAPVGVGDSQTSERTTSNYISVFLQQSRHLIQQTVYFSAPSGYGCGRPEKWKIYFALWIAFRFFVLKFPERFQSWFGSRGAQILGTQGPCWCCGLEGWEDWSFGRFGSADQNLKKEWARKIVVLIHQPSTVHEQSSKKGKYCWEQKPTMMLWQQASVTLFTFQTFLSKGYKE